jgi:L-alanine-DL-glutamate epimerase-like enolase superfamily enzyme
MTAAIKRHIDQPEQTEKALMDSGFEVRLAGMAVEVTLTTRRLTRSEVAEVLGCETEDPHDEFKGFKPEVPFECKTSPLVSVNGVVKVPTGPGLGVDIDPEFIRKHQPVTV